MTTRHFSVSRPKTTSGGYTQTSESLSFFKDFKVKKALALGNESFVQLIESDCYFVDKTPYIKPLMESGGYVQLITRPRRFGKSLFLDMLRRFLAVNPEAPGDISLQEKLFHGLKIREDTTFCERFMGKVPVLYLTFKAVEGPTFEWAYSLLGLRLAAVARKHAWLLASPHLSEKDKADLRLFGTDEFMTDPAKSVLASTFLAKMTGWLALHFGKPVVLLIDEYDVPLQKAAGKDWYQTMLTFMKAFLSPLKSGGEEEIDHAPAIGKAFITGCLRVSKASIFTDVNNFDVDTVCQQGGSLSSAIGFTEKDVTDLLAYYGLSAQKTLVKEWYDGYQIGHDEIYCPWDVIHYCSDITTQKIDPQTFTPENYWAETSGNEVIDEFLNFLDQRDAEKMQILMDGGEIELRINEQLTYGEFKNHRSDDFWTLLLFTGYLTVSSRLSQGLYRLRIPNAEIHATFKARIQSHFSQNNGVFVRHGEMIGQAAFSGDARTMQRLLSEILESYVSVRDAATKAKSENYYHGFLIGLLGSADAVIKNLRSNPESGNGYADLLFTSSGADVGVVVEIKHCHKTSAMEENAEAALTQINEQNYKAGLKGYGCSKIIGYGIAFSGKSCVVMGRLL